MEELGFACHGVLDQFPLRRDQRPLHVAVGQQQFVSDARMLIAKHGHEALAFVRVWRGHAGQITHRGREIMEIAQGIGAVAGRHARAGDHRGRTHRVLVEILLAEQAVAPEGESMVACEEDDRVVEPTLRLERRDDAGDLRVHALDTGVVVGQRG